MGDPIETNTAGEFYARKEGDLYVGSVKGNLGCVTRPALPIDSDANEALPRCRHFLQPPGVHSIPRIIDESVPDLREQDDPTQCKPRQPQP